MLGLPNFWNTPTIFILSHDQWRKKQLLLKEFAVLTSPRSSRFFLKRSLFGSQSPTRDWSQVAGRYRLLSRVRGKVPLQFSCKLEKVKDGGKQFFFLGGGWGVGNFWMQLSSSSSSSSVQFSSTIHHRKSSSPKIYQTSMTLSFHSSHFSWLVGPKRKNLSPWWTLSRFFKSKHRKSKSNTFFVGSNFVRY